MHCCVGDLKGSFIPMRVVYPNLCSTEHQRKCCKKKLFAICENQMNRHPVMQKTKQKQIKPEASFSEVICTATVQSQNPQTLPTNFLTKTQDCGNKVDFKCLFTIYYLLLYFCGGVWVGVVLASENPHLQDRNSEIWSHNSWNERWAL